MFVEKSSYRQDGRLRGDGHSFDADRTHTAKGREPACARSEAGFPKEQMFIIKLICRALEKNSPPKLQSTSPKSLGINFGMKMQFAMERLWNLFPDSAGHGNTRCGSKGASQVSSFAGAIKQDPLDLPAARLRALHKNRTHNRCAPDTP